MNRVFGEHLGLYYDYGLGSDLIGTLAAARRHGLNCGAAARLVVNDLLGINLPQDLRVMGWAFSGLTERVSSLAEMRIGDQILLGLANPPVALDEFEPVYDGGEMINFNAGPVRHIGIFTGEYAAGIPLIFHASAKEGVTTITPLDELMRPPQHRAIHAITRISTAVLRAGQLATPQITTC